MVAFAIFLGAGPPGAKCTASTTGDGIWPSWRTVTVVREPAVRTLAIDPSTASVAKSHEYQNHPTSWCRALLMKKACSHGAGCLKRHVLAYSLIARHTALSPPATTPPSIESIIGALE